MITAGICVDDGNEVDIVVEVRGRANLFSSGGGVMARLPY